MIAVYAGSGSSHSWTWFASLCSSFGVDEVRFVTESDIRRTDLDRPDLLVVSGGDGFEIAHSMGARGLERLRDFVSDGGTYVGVCAGAYLALPSSLEPFRHFNISTTRIRNISGRGDLLDQDNPRISVRYGSCAVYHPVRGPIVVEGQGISTEAPVYGGPVFDEPGCDEVLFRYSGFTPETAFQTDRPTADSLVLGSPAAIKVSHGKGRAFLLGPHLEHPRYAAANSILAELLGFGRVRPTSTGPRGSVPPGLKRSLADLKVAILGLENASFVVGKKLWDGGRLLELVDAVEGWSPSLDADSAIEVSSLLDEVASSLRSDRSGRQMTADSAPRALVEAARLCANRHFGSVHG